MDASKSTIKKASTRVEWMWNANRDSSSTAEPIDWRHYSDIENRMIEEASTARQSQVMLDDCHIDFNGGVQISDNDPNEQRPIKRVVHNTLEIRLRDDRFLPDPFAPDLPFGMEYGFVSPFIKETAKQLKLTRDQLPSKDKTVIPMVVEKAAVGILEEGKKQGKQREAQYIATVLRTNRRKGIKDIWKRCAYFYSLESFLYKTLNEYMRLIGSPEHEEIWRRGISTLGPFCLLLWDDPFNKKMIRPGTVLYRGAHLSDDVITSYKRECSQHGKIWHTFQAFTSCSRNRTFAEQFGNVLFIMKARIAFTIDLSPFSEYAYEEEEILYPGVSVTIDQVESSENNDKHFIYLTLQHKHLKRHYQHLNETTTQTNESHNTIEQLPSQPEPEDQHERPSGISLSTSFETSSFNI